MSPRLSALVVARNEEVRLAECLGRLEFADECVVVLDRCTDGSAAIAKRYADIVVEGAWPIEGDRRNAGLDACSGDWILEVDADESVSVELGLEIKSHIAQVDSGYFLIPFLNYVGVTDGGLLGASPQHPAYRPKEQNVGVGNGFTPRSNSTDRSDGFPIPSNTRSTVTFPT